MNTPNKMAQDILQLAKDCAKAEAWNIAHLEHIKTIEGKLCDAIRDNVALELRVTKLKSELGTAQHYQRVAQERADTLYSWFSTEQRKRQVLENKVKELEQKHEN